MSYHPAFRLDDPKMGSWTFTRCNRCVCLVADVDVAAHDGWHELVDAAMESIVKLAGEIDALKL